MACPNMIREPTLGGRYEIGEALGTGGFATVFRGLDMKSGLPVALKRLDKTPQNKHRAVLEISLATTVPHPHIVTIYDMFFDNEYIYIVMELLEGTLFDRLRSRPLTEEELFRILYQLVSALQHLHLAGVTHRDIKLENIMFDRKDNVKLVDFGLATDHAISHSKVGSPHYMAPELWYDEESSYETSKVDAWALGCVLYCMVFRSMPFLKTSSMSVGTKILTKPCVVPSYVNSTVGTVDPKLRDLMVLLLSKDAAHRLSVKSIPQQAYWIANCRKFNLHTFGVEPSTDQSQSPGASDSSLSFASQSSKSSKSDVTEDERLPRLRCTGHWIRKDPPRSRLHKLRRIFRRSQAHVEQ